MPSFKISPSGEAIVLDIYPKRAFGSDIQKIDFDGTPLWTVKTLMDCENSSSVFVNVTVPSKEKPKFGRTEKVNFENLVLSYSKINGEMVVWLQADAVTGGGLNG